MPEDAKQEKQRPGEQKKGGRGRAALVVVVLVFAVVGVLAVVNRDNLLVHSDVTTPPTETPATAEPNRPPEIAGLTVASDRIEPFSMCDIQCDAIDPDGDELSYEWTVSDGDIFGTGAAIEWGSPVAEGLYRVSVTVTDGRGGSADYSVPLRVKSNAVPVLASLTADADFVFAGNSIRLSCEVADADGDAVSLEWTATGGELFGEGPAVIWMAPEVDDVYWVTVVARDTYGGEATRALPISVTSGVPPAIDGLFLQGFNTDMLRNRGNDWLIYQGRSTTLTCAMLDTTGIYTYEWSADYGTLVPNGATATWQAPANRVGATILVVVSDERGNKSSASVLIYVETCTCSF